MVDLCARHADVADAVEAAVAKVLRSGRHVGGPVVAELESELAARNGCVGAVGCNSGTDALRLALQAVGVGPGDEVIVPAVSFYATAEAVLQLGAVPRVVDVLEDRPLMDPERAAAAMGSRTRAIVPVHLFGALAPDLDHLGLPVVDDAAQAVVGTPSRCRGQLSAVSFYPTKVLGAAGDGGLVLGRDPELLERVRRAANHGQVGDDQFAAVGTFGVCGNSRLDPLQAAILMVHLQRLDSRIARRRAIAARYAVEFGDLAVAHDPQGPVSVFAIRHPQRDALAEALRGRGVATRVYYRRPLSAQPLVPDAPTPRADRFCAEVLALPVHADLDDAQVDHILAAVRELA